MLIALAKRLEVAVGVGLDFEAGVGDAVGSAGRARLDEEACCSSGDCSLTLRLTDKLDSLPVMPFAWARCFFASSICFLRVELC